MSSIELITKNIWTELTKAVKQSETKSMVAVAYFAKNAAKMLPLNKGSVLVVNASLQNLKCGSICPDDLLELYYKGVHIYSHEYLHAKLYIIGSSLYCGSANVSPNSANNLKEVLLKTNNKEAINDAKTFIKTLSNRIELGEEEIIRMNQFYNPPKNFGIRNKSDNSNSSNFYIVNLRTRPWSEKEQQEADKGRETANKNRINKSRHRVDEFSWGSKVSFKKGDTILQITKEDDKKYVTPIGKLIHIRKWSNGKSTRHICFVEVPNKRRKNLEIVKKQLDNADAKSILRGGKKKIELENSIKQLWV